MSIFPRTDTLFFHAEDSLLRRSPIRQTTQVVALWFGMREAVGGGNVNRTSSDVIPLCSTSVLTKCSASPVMIWMITRAGHHPAKRIGKIAISIPFDRHGRLRSRYRSRLS